MSSEYFQAYRRRYANLTRAEEGNLIGNRDFFLRRGGSEFFGLMQLGKAVTFDGAVEAANAWIATEDIRVITVETMIVGRDGRLLGCRV